MVAPFHPTLSISRQCELLSISRSGYYYQPQPENILLMRLMDEHHLQHPYYGVERMCQWLNRDCALDFPVNRKRVRLLFRKMGLRSHSPGPHTSRPSSETTYHYPYLLRDLVLSHPNQVWATGITYVPMNQGFMYLMAVMDLYSRRVLGWDVSNTMEASWCASVLSEILASSAEKSEIFNIDQGSQFTSAEFVGVLQRSEILMSMDGKGRARDNAFVERLWRTVKYEYIYLHVFDNGQLLYQGLMQWFDWYNTERRHPSLGWQPPGLFYQQMLKPATTIKKAKQKK